MLSGGVLRVASFALSILLAAGVARAQAQTPVALVEDVVGKPEGVAFMDYVAPGQVIALGPRDGIVLGYIRSCWRERIRGGTVRIGQEQSEVTGGAVERVRIACDGGRMELAAEQTRQSTASVFRDPGRQKRAALPRPQFVLHGRSPLIELEGGGALSLERLDASGETLMIELPAAKLLRGAFADLADAGVALTPGGLYLARAGERQLVFQVSADAAPGKSPIAGRLVRLR
ncbi:MAG: hypothetical protein KF889_23995 [Alphaproteobacteria bacterium]|nr:hypothetical protein [Alphaproteobacteria bacterium]MCW5742520.1 hypothetical protein [Alphaproteobacteria bacterium]